MEGQGRFNKGKCCKNLILERRGFQENMNSKVYYKITNNHDLTQA